MYKKQEASIRTVKAVHCIYMLHFSNLSIFSRISCTKKCIYIDIRQHEQNRVLIKSLSSLNIRELGRDWAYTV